MNLPNQLSINKIQVQDIISAGLLKEYVVFLKIKAKYPNSCFYAYTQKRLSAKTGIPLNCIRKCVKVFLERGWCRMHCNNLIFNPLKTFDEHKQRLITSINLGKPIKDILSDLYLIVLRLKQEQFDKLKKLGCELHKPCSHWSYKRALRTLRKIKAKKSALPKGSDHLSISIKNISLMLNVSMGKCHKILTDLYKKGRITVYPGEIRRIMYTTDKIKLNAVASSGVYGLFIIGNCVYQNTCHCYNFFE
jgi:hypothetical protein